MRIAALALALMLATACDNFASVQDADTIEAYEGYIAENPDSRFMTQAKIRLEELYLEKARTDKTLEAYDVYLAKFPEGSDAQHRETALEERRTFLMGWAEEQNTVESWQKFLDEYPGAKKKEKRIARMALQMAQYDPNIEMGDVRVEGVNLAEDPEGPENGWGYYVDVTNKGDKTVSSLMLRIDYLGPDGQPFAHDTWPVVAPLLPGGLPVEEEFKIPMKPGETRTWFWSKGKEAFPADYAKGANVRTYAVRFEGEKDDDE